MHLNPTKVEDFVRVWTTARHVAEVAEILQITKSAAQNKARRLRVLGIRLKEMPRSHKEPLDIKKLNRLIKTL